MDTLKKTFAQARRVWERSNRGAQIATVALAVISLVAIVSVGIWSTQPQYHPLASGLAPDEIASVISRLEAEKISYELNHAGTTISVPKSQWSAARVAAGEAIIPDGGPPNQIDGSPLDPPSVQRFRMHRNLERMLQATIGRMQSVKRATVHISQSEEELFVRPEETARAAVQLELERGRRFSREQVESVIALVSHAIVGLAPENVTVTDTQGNSLSSAHRSGLDAAVEMQFEYRQRIESYLAAKAETMLSRMLGLNKVVVRVTADIDFNKLTTKQTTYDSDGRVTSKETTESKSRNQASRTPIGPVGTTPNISGAATTGRKEPTSEKEELLDAEYKVPETVEEIVEAPGAIKRITVAAMVDLANARSQTPVTAEQIKALIQVATGFDPQRNDSIEVIEATLPDIEVLDAPVAPGGWDQIRDIVQVVSLGLASLVALVFGWLTLRRVKPITLNSSDGSELEARRARIMTEISQHASRDPETVSRIVSAWLDEPLKSDSIDETSSPPVNQPRAAA